MRAYAQRSGLTSSTVSRQVRDGIIPTHGPKKLIDPVEAHEARGTKLDHSFNKGQVIPISDARALRLAAQAELGELELARQKRQPTRRRSRQQGRTNPLSITKNGSVRFPRRSGRSSPKSQAVASFVQIHQSRISTHRAVISCAVSPSTARTGIVAKVVASSSLKRNVRPMYICS